MAQFTGLGPSGQTPFRPTRLTSDRFSGVNQMIQALQGGAALAERDKQQQALAEALGATEGPAFTGGAAGLDPALAGPAQIPGSPQQGAQAGMIPGMSSQEIQALLVSGVSPDALLSMRPETVSPLEERRVAALEEQVEQGARGLDIREQGQANELALARQQRLQDARQAAQESQSERLNQTLTVSERWGQRTEDLVQIADAYKGIQASRGEESNRITDQNLLRNIAVMQNPDIPVAELPPSAFAQLFPNVSNAITVAAGTGELGEEERVTLERQAESIMASAAADYRTLEQGARERAETFGLDPEQAVPNFLRDLRDFQPPERSGQQQGMGPQGGDPAQRSMAGPQSPDDVARMRLDQVRSFVDQASEAALDAMPESIRDAINRRLRGG